MTRSWPGIQPGWLETEGCSTEPPAGTNNRGASRRLVEQGQRIVPAKPRRLHHRQRPQDPRSDQPRVGWESRNTIEGPSLGQLPNAAWERAQSLQRASWEPMGGLSQSRKGSFQAGHQPQPFSSPCPQPPSASHWAVCSFPPTCPMTIQVLIPTPLQKFTARRSSQCPTWTPGHGG